jgi:hypothetical protein
MSRNLKGLISTVSGALSTIENFKTAGGLAGGVFSALLGREVGNDAPAVAQGVSGFFGKGDERTMQILFSRLTREEQKMLRGFLLWHFAGETMQDKLLAMWYLGSFRVFVTGIKGSNEAVGSVKKETVTTDQETGAKTTIVVDDKDYGDAYKHAVEFLKFIVTTIRSGKMAHKKTVPTSTEEEQLVAGYQLVLEHFRATGVPHMPPKSDKDWGEWARATGTTSVEQAKLIYDETRTVLRKKHGEVLEAEKSEWSVWRFLRNLIS